MSTPNALPPLPQVGPIGYASVVDIDSYAKTLVIGTHLPGVRDVALWTTDQKRAYAIAATSAKPVAQEPLQDAKDAERYRWLIAQTVGWSLDQNKVHIKFEASPKTRDLFDITAAIDAAKIRCQNTRKKGQS